VTAPILHTFILYISIIYLHKIVTDIKTNAIIADYEQDFKTYFFVHIVNFEGFKILRWALIINNMIIGFLILRKSS